MRAHAQSAPVPGPPVTPPQLTDLEPREPYRLLVPGLLTRTRYVADRGQRHAVEVWDLMVGPGQATATAHLPGSAVVEVRSGTGVFTSRSTPRELRIGMTFVLDEAAEFAVTNADKEAPLILRVTLIHSVQR